MRNLRTPAKPDLVESENIRPRAQDTDGTGHRGQMSAGQISGSNPDEMDGEGAAFGRIAGRITLHIAHNFPDAFPCTIVEKEDIVAIDAVNLVAACVHSIPI